jgi:hypothetical protein
LGECRRQRMAISRLLIVLPISFALTACLTVGPMNGRKPDGPLTKADIDACLAAPHRVGDDTISPQPQPHHVFKPGYNFTMKMPDGSYGFGYEEASDGHILVKYPKHGTAFDYGVARKDGVVYFGDKATSCE